MWSQPSIGCLTTAVRLWYEWPMARKPRKKRPHVFTAYVYRNNAAGEEQEIEVEVDFDYEGADPSVGIMSGSFELCEAIRTDTLVPIELTEAELERISEQAMQRACDAAQDAAYDAAEARGDY